MKKVRKIMVCLFVAGILTMFSTVISASASDDTIATVENGRVTGLADGSTVITAVTEDGLKVASCIVNVDLNDSQQFVLSYRGNGGEEIPDDETYTSGQTAIISQVIPVRQGYRFIGWGLNPDTKKVAYQPGDSLIMNDAVATEKIAKLDDPETEDEPQSPDPAETPETPSAPQISDPQGTPTTPEPSGASTTPPASETLGTTDHSDAPRSSAVGTQIIDLRSGGIYRVSAAGISGQATVEYKAPYNKKAVTVNIPNSVVIGDVTYKVTSIAVNAFKNNKSLKKVKIGNNITTVGANAFSGCKKLNNITLGSSVTVIGTKAFYKCAALRRITVPKKVEKIGTKAFYGCTNLKSVTLKTTKLTTKSVGAKAFAKIHSKAVIKVPKKAFKSYKKLLMQKGVNSQSAIKK